MMRNCFLFLIVVTLLPALPVVADEVSLEPSQDAFVLPGETAAETDQGCTEESEMDSLETVPDGLSATLDSTCCSGECLRLMPTPPPEEWIIEEEDPEEVPKLPKTS